MTITPEKLRAEIAEIDQEIAILRANRAEMQQQLMLLGRAETRIASVLAKSPEPMQLKKVANDTGLKMVTAHAALRKMAEAGTVKRVGHGLYRAAVAA